MANNLPPPKIAIFERVIWSAGRQKSLSVRSGGAGFDRFRHGARNCPFDTSHLVRPVGAPGDFAVITAPHNQSDFAAVLGPNSKWRNEFAARLMLRFGFYRPGLKAKRLKMPLLVTVCDQDTITPAAPAVKAAERAPRAELRRYPCRHFQIYSDPQVKADQVAF